MKKAAAALLLLCIATFSAAQSPKWEREDKTDALRGATYALYTLTGKFLTPPKNASDQPPLFVVKCIPGTHRKGTGATDGKLLDALISVNADVVQSGKYIHVQYRLDDGKIHQEPWYSGPDPSAIVVPAPELNNVLYGHILVHKEGTNPAVRKLVLAVDEHRGAEVVMQFDMPDPDEMADACGLLYRKK